METVQAADIIQLLEAVPLHVVMGEPRLVALWARCEYSVGDNAAAISRAKAALHLAEYSGDHDALAASRSVWIDALCRIQRYEEAASIVRQIPIQGSVDAQVASLLISGTVLMYVGQLEEARSPLARAAALTGRGICGSQESLRLAHTSCLLEMLVTGSWARFVGDVSAMLPDAQPWPSDSLRMKGNLAIGLLELGRVERAGALLTSVTEFASDELAATYMTFLGCVLVAQGECDRGLRSAGRALELGYMLGLEADAAMNRVYLATLLRACGDTTAALGHAERAYERLCVVNYQGCRPLATVEVAASLLSLDDEAGARRWLESLLESGITQNHYHALRAAMVLAECDRRDGELQRGIDRLAEHRDHILSESSNWQIAMYVRAFPGLLGMFASALGSDALPVHMLRMVLPEYAENALQMCRAWLDHREWTALGVRLLGEAEFARAEQRGEERPCRVRLFGGLSVVVADRTIAERDWKKSKARLLFAMLVSKRGQEVPREQVLDYLWPDLPEDRAKNNFYVAWSSMKRALMGIVDRTEACPYLENKGGRLRIVSDTVRSDIDDFEDMLAEAREAEASDDHRRALEAYGRLSTIYRGDLLPGDLYDDWFSGLRDRCRFDFVDAMVRAVEILLEQDEPCEALAYARRAQQVDPIREDLYQVVMRCSIAAGQRNAAIDAFLQLRARLSDDLGLDPSAESMALYQQILVMENRPRYDDYGLS